MSAYNEIIDAYYRAWFRYHPEAAVDLGVEGYSEVLMPYGDDDIGALITLHEKLIDSLDELDHAALTPDQQIDARLMRGQALIESKYLIEHDWRLRDPARFLPVNAIYQLTIRPVKDRGTALRARLSAIPGYLRGAKQHLLTEAQSIPPIWLEAALAEATQGVKYLRDLRQHPPLQHYRLDSELDSAARALEEFARFMERELAPRANGDFACGRDMFEMLLRYRHGLDINADELHAFGARLYERVLVELKRACSALQGDDNIAALTQRIQTQYRPERDLLGLYRESMQAAHEFVRDKRLVSLPATEHLHVVETPGFLRHQIPFAAYLEPMPTDPAQTAYYYVTPPQDEASRGEHNLVSLQHTCVHEAWPGHHLQFVTANSRSSARSLPRLLNASATLYEGWALYCEQLMFEQGFLHQPESEFVLLKDQLWRALRVMIDVDIQVRGRSLAEVAGVMQARLGFSHAQAMGELSWYSRSPAVPMGYATGWALISKARERMQGLADFNLREFHDRLLSVGSIGLPWVMRRAFGEPLWRSLREDVFQAD